MAVLVSVGSGKGGTGKSMLATNLAVLFAKEGWNTCLVDLDVGGADAHVMFGVFKPEKTLSHFLGGEASSLYKVMQRLDAFHGLYLIPGTGETLKTANMPYQTKMKLLRHLRSLEAQIVFLDVGAGTSLHVLDFFMASSIQIGVATPDPTSILDFYRFLKLAAIRKVLSAFLSHEEVSRMLAKEDFQEMEAIFGIAERLKPGSGEVARRALDGFRPTLVFNKVQQGGFSGRRKLQHIVKRFLGVELPELGEIPWDLLVEESIGSYIPVVEYAPGSSASKALEKIARRLRTEIAALQG